MAVHSTRSGKDLVPSPTRVKTFRNARAFETWMRKNHAREPELWLKIYKKGSGVSSITLAEALDEKAYLQRYTPRGRKVSGARSIATMSRD